MARVVASSRASCGTAVANRRLRSGTIQPSCTRPAAAQPHHSCQQRRGGPRAASRDTSTQDFPQPGETIDFPSDALPRQSEEAQLATVPSFAPAPLEFPPLGGALAAQFPDPLMGNAEQQYRSIALHGCMFYVAAEGDMLRLDDVHVLDTGSGEWSRPTGSGDLPRQAALYQQIPWVKEKHGDYMKHKETELEVLKVFLIRRDPATQLLDFGHVITLDGEQRAVVREEVGSTTDVTDPEQLSLRIRDGRITLELSPAMPSVEEVVQAAMEDREPESDMPEMPQEAPAAEEEDEEMDDDFDAPDIPAIDFA